MPYLPGNINDRLRELRESRHLSEREAAEQLGINPSTYSRMEKADGNEEDGVQFLNGISGFLMNIAEDIKPDPKGSEDLEEVVKES